jgi:hypothetical protein
MSDIKRKQLYEVSAIEVKSKSEWDVTVIASSSREARKLGVDALEKIGLINRRNIKKTSVHCTGQDVWVV